MSVTLYVTLLSVLIWAFRLYSYAIIIYIFMSWLPGARESVIGQWLAKIVEPYLEIFRRIIPPFGMIDFSPIIAIFVFNMFRVGVFSILDQFISPLFYK